MHAWLVLINDEYGLRYDVVDSEEHAYQSAATMICGTIPGDDGDEIDNEYDAGNYQAVVELYSSWVERNRAERERFVWELVISKYQV